MNKLGKEAKVLLYGITITCVISFILAFGISSLMAKEYQKDLMQHDYFVAGYLLNHSDALKISAFTAERNENDIETGRTHWKLSDMMTTFPQNCFPLFCYIEIVQ